MYRNIWCMFVLKFRVHDGSQTCHHQDHFMQLSFYVCFVGMILNDFKDSPNKREVCKMDWTLLHERWSLGEQALQSLCFSAAYVVVLLHHGLGFDKKSQQISFVPQGNISWAKGAIIWEANNRFSQHQPLCIPAKAKDVCTGAKQ